MAEIMFERIALIGIGLIGSSIARDVKELGLARHVTISTRSEDTLKRAEELALGTDYTVSAAEAVKDADLVIVSVPVGASESVAQQIAPHLKPGAIVTDVGSTKASVIAQMAPHMPDNVHFIPGHPLAGTEKSGPDAGFAGLFRDRWCIFTPLPGTDAEALERLKDFWRALGSRVDEMDAEHHDKVLAIVSHLPHIIAYNIVGTADDLETVTESEVIKYSASGFRDFTRLAASDPTMWRDVCLHNKDAILEMLARFSEDLASLQRAIRWGEGDKLFELFSRTRAIRRSIVQAGQDVGGRAVAAEIGAEDAVAGRGRHDDRRRRPVAEQNLGAAVGWIHDAADRLGADDQGRPCVARVHVGVRHHVRVHEARARGDEVERSAVQSEVVLDVGRCGGETARRGDRRNDQKIDLLSRETRVLDRIGSRGRGQRDGVFAVTGNAAFLDASALGDPLVRRVECAFQIGVGQTTFGQRRAHPRF